MDDAGGEWAVTLTYSMVDQTIRCVGMSVLSVGDPRPLTTVVLRSIPYAAWVHDDLWESPQELVSLVDDHKVHIASDLGDKGLGFFASEFPEDGKKRGRGRPTVYPLSHYEEVADIYRRAPSRPTMTVAEHFDARVAQASGWVKKARELGLLDSDTRHVRRQPPAKRPPSDDRPTG